jgi:hypothetical protein
MIHIYVRPVYLFSLPHHFFVTFLTGGLRVDVDAVDSDSATAAATFDSMISFRSPSKAVVSNALG